MGFKLVYTNVGCYHFNFLFNKWTCALISPTVQPTIKAFVRNEKKPAYGLYFLSAKGRVKKEGKCDRFFLSSEVEDWVYGFRGL